MPLQLRKNILLRLHDRKEGGDNKEEDEAFHLKMSLRAVALRTGHVWRCLVLGTPAVT